MTIQLREFSDAVFEQFSRVGKALSHAKRLQLLTLLIQAERTVEVLAEEIGISVASASQHLQVLRSARLVEAHKHGLYVTYRVSDPAVQNLLQDLRMIAEHQIAEVEQITRRFLEGRPEVEAVDMQHLLERLRSNDVTVLDVRPVDEYRAGHIPGALSTPLKELVAYIADLPKDKDVVAYCRGPYCLMAIQAVEMLRAQGYHAAHLADGVREWIASGHELEEGDEPGTVNRQ